MQVRATGKTSFRAMAGLPLHLLRCTVLTGIASAAFMGAATAQDRIAVGDMCAEPMSAADRELCEIAQGSMLLDRITVISRTGESPIESLASVSQVDREALDRRMPSSANDVFFGVPGIAIQTDARRSGSAANVRGLQDFGRVQVIVDGARQNFNRYGHGTGSMVFIDPNLLDTVEVIRGPVANTYGSGAVGGVVMFNTKTADTFLRPGEQHALETTVNFDSNAKGLTASATGAVQLTENVGVLGNVVVRNFGTYTDGAGNEVVDSDFEVTSGLLKATIRPTEHSTLNLGWNGSNNQWTELTGARAVESRQNIFSAQFEHDDPNNDLVDFHLNASVSVIDYGAVNLAPLSRYSEAAGGFVTVPAGAETGYDLTTFSLDAWNTSILHTGPVTHELTYGGDLVHDRVETSNPIANSGSDPYNPSGRRTVGGVYLQDKATYQWLEAIAGLRYDVYELESGGISNSGSRLSPRLTLGVSPFEEGPLSGLQVYGTYAEGYRSPSITETLIDGTHPAFAIFPFLPNPNLNPETARTWEFGVNYRAEGLVTAEDRLQLKAAYFNNAISNYIGMNDSIPTGTGGCAAPPAGPIFAPGFPPRVVGINTGTCAQFQNFAAAEIQGFELEALYDQQTWFAGLSASIIEGHVQEGGLQSPLLSIPTTQVTGTAGFRLFEGALTVGGEVQHNWMPEGATGADYTLVNLFASYKANENVSFNARVDNLFDVQYANPLTASTTSPVYEPGLSVKLGTTVRF